MYFVEIVSVVAVTFLMPMYLYMFYLQIRKREDFTMKDMLVLGAIIITASTFSGYIILPEIYGVK